MDVIGNGVRVMRIASGEIEEEVREKSAAAELGSKGGGIVDEWEASQKDTESA